MDLLGGERKKGTDQAQADCTRSFRPQAGPAATVLLARLPPPTLSGCFAKEKTMDTMAMILGISNIRMAIAAKSAPAHTTFLAA